MKLCIPFHSVPFFATTGIQPLTICPPNIVRSTPDAICWSGLVVPELDTTSTLSVARSAIAFAFAVADTGSI